MMWCLDHLGISQVIQFEVLPERSILEICVTHMLLIDSFSRKHGIDLCIWEIATDVFGKIIWDHTFCSGDAKDDSSVCLNTMSIILQLQCNSSSGWKSPQPRLICFESQTKSTANHIFQRMKPNHWFMFDVLKFPVFLLHLFFRFNPSPSLSLYQVCCYRSYTAPKPQDPRLGVGSSWDVSSFGQLEMASWEWNMSKSCWSFKSWRMGMDAYYLTLLLVLVGMSRLEWGGAGSFVDMICGNILFETHGPRL